MIFTCQNPLFASVQTFILLSHHLGPVSILLMAADGTWVTPL